MATNKKKRQTKLSSLSKDKALDDALRTRTHRKLKKTNVAADLLTRGRSSKGLANIKVEGRKANTHMKDISPRSDLLSRKERLERAKRGAKSLQHARLNAKIVKQLVKNQASYAAIKDAVGTPTLGSAMIAKKKAAKAKMYPPPKNKKSLLEKMKATAKKIPGTETNKRAKRNKKVVTGVGRRPTRKDKD